MAIVLLLSQNTYFSPPGGYPFALGGVGEYIAEGTITADISVVTASVKAGATADVHLALYEVPTTVDGPDGDLVAQSDLTGVTSQQQDITVAVPAGNLPACYVVRLWVDNITATIADTVIRSTAAGYSIALNPGIPQSVSILAVTVN